MKRPVLHQLAFLCIAASVFFSAAPFAQANTFSLPQQISYPGLTFSDPLTYSHPISLAEPTSSISFTAHNELMITKSDSKKPLETIVLTPTLSITEVPVHTTPQPTPALTITSTQASTPTPTTQPAEDTTPTVTQATDTPAPQSNAGGLNADTLFTMVNNYRAANGLPAFQQDAKTCSLAQTRAPMVAGEVASGTMHSGLRAMDLPYWNTENIISMNSEQAAFNWWINDTIHREAILGNYQYSCVACSGNNCAEEFTNYQPK